VSQEGMKKKRLGGLDICILAAVILCVVGIAARMVFQENSILGQNKPLESYKVYFTVSNIRGSSAVYLRDGTEFYIEENNEYFGVLNGTPTTTPAAMLYTDASGMIVQVYNDTDDDRVARIDVEGAFTVSGILKDDGSLLLNGTRYIAPNKELELCSKELDVIVKITSIVKAG